MKNLRFICTAVCVSGLLLLSQCKNDNGTNDASTDQSRTDGEGTDGFERSMDDNDENTTSGSGQGDSLGTDFDTMNKPMP